MRKNQRQHRFLTAAAALVLALALAAALPCAVWAQPAGGPLPDEPPLLTPVAPVPPQTPEGRVPLNPAEWVLGSTTVTAHSAQVYRAPDCAVSYATMYAGETVPVLNWNAGRGCISVSVNGDVGFMKELEIDGRLNPNRINISRRVFAPRQDNVAVFAARSYDSAVLIYLGKGKVFVSSMQQDGWAYYDFYQGWVDMAGLVARGEL